MKPAPHPVIVHITENHAAIARKMQERIRQHRRYIRAAEARALALGIYSGATRP